MTTSVPIGSHKVGSTIERGDGEAVTLGQAAGVVVVDLDADANVEAAVVVAAVEGGEGGGVPGARHELAAVQGSVAVVAGQVARRRGGRGGAGRVAVLDALAGAGKAAVRAVLSDDGVVPAGHGDAVGRRGFAAVARVLVEQAEQRLVRVWVQTVDLVARG